jgi:hydroxymethylglutaryl-CoA lyase
MSLPKQIYIRELGLREGLQTISGVIPTESKLEILKLLVETGVPEIEVTAFVRPDRVPQMADARELALQLPEGAGLPRFTALYLNSKGFEQAEQIPQLNNSGWLYTSASEAFLTKNNNLTKEQALAGVPGWLEKFSQHDKSLHGLMISTAFGYYDDGIIEAGAFMDLLGRYIRLTNDLGHSIKELSIADTTGYANPQSVKRLVSLIKDSYPELELSLHLHDTRGLGIANVMAGIESGISIFDSSVGGVGGCPFARGAAGNVCTEEIVLLCNELGIQTGIKLDEYCQAARAMEALLQQPLAGKVHRWWMVSK